eukprot:Gb_04206 [translate_table: standard]
MGMNAYYGPLKSKEEMINLICYAISKGITFLDTSEVYGPFTNEVLMGKVLGNLNCPIRAIQVILRPCRSLDLGGIGLGSSHFDLKDVDEYPPLFVSDFGTASKDDDLPSHLESGIRSPFLDVSRVSEDNEENIVLHSLWGLDGIGSTFQAKKLTSGCGGKGFHLLTCFFDLKGMASSSPRKKKRRCVKKKDMSANLVLGEDVKMNEVLDMASHMGWLAVLLRSVEDVKKLQLDYTPVWVKVPGLPIDFWSLEVFKKIGNELAMFLEADMSFLDTGQMTPEKVLVGIDLRDGLAPKMMLQKGYFTYTQNLDYIGVWDEGKELSDGTVIAERNMALSIGKDPGQVTLADKEVTMDFHFLEIPDRCEPGGPSGINSSCTIVLGGGQEKMRAHDRPCSKSEDEHRYNLKRRKEASRDVEGSIGGGLGSLVGGKYKGGGRGRLGTLPHSQVMGKEITYLNLHDTNQIFWWRFFNSSMTRSGLVLLGDLNFSLGRSKVWGPTVHMDLLLNFFIRSLEEVGLLDIDPSILDEQLQIRQWVSFDGGLDHFPMLLKLASAGRKPSSPFKINPNWKKVKDEKDLLNVEVDLETLYLQELDGFPDEAFKGGMLIPSRGFTRSDGIEASIFEDLALARVDHFKEDNKILMDEISKYELKEVLVSFQKDKSLGPDGWPVEFFIGFSEVIEEELMRVIEESRAFGKVLLVWKVGRGNRVRLGEDPWVADHGHSSIWRQEWLSEGYKALCGMDSHGSFEWWWKYIWNFNCPLKSCIFMWLALNNKGPTWDVLKKGGKIGPSRSPLCKESEETINHLLLTCLYAISVWKEVGILSGLKVAWEGSTLEESLRKWCENRLAKFVLALPLIIAWGIWLMQNASLFQGIQVASFHCATQGIIILSSFKHVPIEKAPRHIS